MLCHSRIASARCGFVMYQVSVGRPNNLPASLSQAQTKIDVVKVVRQILVKAAELIEDRFSQCHACGGNRSNFAIRRTFDSSARWAAGGRRRTFFHWRTGSMEEQSALAPDQQLVLTCERVSQSSAFALGSRRAACRFGRNLPSRSHRLAS
jgi:hypothetical protein